MHRNMQWPTTLHLHLLRTHVETSERGAKYPAAAAAAAAPKRLKPQMVQVGSMGYSLKLFWVVKTIKHLHFHNLYYIIP